MTAKPPGGTWRQHGDRRADPCRGSVSGRGRLLQHAGQVHAAHDAVPLDGPAGDQHGAHIGVVVWKTKRPGCVEVRVLGRAGAADHDQVGLLAGGEAADPVAETDRLGRVDRRPAQRLQGGGRDPVRVARRRGSCASVSAQRLKPRPWRIWLNRSPLLREMMSQDRVGAIPCRSQAANAGRPMPMLSSVSTEIETLAPARARTCHSSSARVLQCTCTWSGPSRPAASSSRMPFGQAPHAAGVGDHQLADRSRAAAISAAVADSGMTPTSVSATPSVTSAESEGK